MHSRYIRDFSFENFGAPALPGDAEPVLGITIEVENRETQDMHEVMLSVKMAAKREEQISFLIDLGYAGLFQVHGMDEPEMRRFLHVEARACCSGSSTGPVPT